MSDMVGSTMSARGRYKYICDDCQTENWLTAIDRNSRFKPHCIECGSIRLSPSCGSKASQKLAEWYQKKRGRDEMLEEKQGISSQDYYVDEIST